MRERERECDTVCVYVYIRKCVPPSQTNPLINDIHALIMCVCVCVTDGEWCVCAISLSITGSQK